ncbi:MAG: 1-deoxy-D-xylulose-5-phosphate synthase, partial [Muribaculaceae bacterium]|nr:1-deoxy-D-xylulose-5-phosphate synthase [Muribaculaceae bacterium]
SISGGLAFEGLNNAANTPYNLLIILNDNDMSIDDNVGSLSNYLTSLNTSKGYNDFRFKAYNFLKKHNMITEDGKGRILRFNNSLKALLTNNHNIFEGLNIRYFGAFDGHDVRKIVKTLREISKMSGPRILHLRTIKGKGYEPAEKSPSLWHAPGKFDPETGKILDEKKNGAPKKYQQIFGETLKEIAEKNKNVVAITAAMASGTSISIMQETMPERVFDVGISEGHALTFAGGLAKDGIRPVVGIYSSFLQRAFDNVIHDVAIQRLPVVICIDRAGLVGEDGVTHHGSYDLSYMSTVPNMIVSAPSDEHTLRNLMHTAISQEQAPFSIRYPRGKGQLTDWRNEMEKMPIGKGRKLKDGKDVIVLSIGTIAEDVKKAISEAEKEGLSVAHYDMLFLKPIDTDILDEAGKSGAPVLTVEDGTVKGGLGSAVLEYFARKQYPNRVELAGIPDMFITQGTVAQLKEICGIDSKGLLYKIKKLAGK